MGDANSQMAFRSSIQPLKLIMSLTDWLRNEPVLLTTKKIVVMEKDLLKDKMIWKEISQVSFRCDGLSRHLVTNGPLHFLPSK